MEKSKRKEREFNLRRSEILEQAEKIFASKGFHSTTVADIAHASGFAVGTLYQFFESKDDLYKMMILEKLGRMFVEIRSAVKEAQGIYAKVEALVRSHFVFVENNEDFCNLFIRGESTTLSDAGAALRDRMIENHLDHIRYVADFIREGVRESSLKVGEPRFMAIALLGIIRSFIFDWMVSPDQRLLSSQVQQVVDIFFYGVKNSEEENNGLQRLQEAQAD